MAIVTINLPDEMILKIKRLRQRSTGGMNLSRLVADLLEAHWRKAKEREKRQAVRAAGQYSFKDRP